MQKHEYMFIFDLWNPYVNSFLKKEILQKLFFHVKLKWLKQNVIFGYLYIFSCVQTEIWFPVFKQRYGFQIFFFRKKSSYLKLFLIPLKTLIKSELFQFFLGNNHKLDIVRFEKFFKIFCIIRNSILMRHTLQC